MPRLNCDPWKVNCTPPPPSSSSNRGPGRVQATLKLSGEDSRPFGGSASVRGEKKERREGGGGGAGGGGGEVVGAG